MRTQLAKLFHSNELRRLPHANPRLWCLTIIIIYTVITPKLLLHNELASHIVTFNTLSNSRNSLLHKNIANQCAVFCNDRSYSVP